MKELSIEEKAKRYDEALERAKNAIKYPDKPCFARVDEIFPELKESEDERIRKEMIEIIKNEAHEFPVSVIAEKSNSWIAWLERQGEQKPAWSEEDNQYLCGLIGLIEQSKAELPITLKGKAADNCINWLKSLRPQNTWKPSDEQMDALRYVTNFDYGGHKATLVSLYEQLKKLK